MAVGFVSTGVQFPDTTIQTTAATAGASGVNTVTVANSPGTWTKPASVKSIKVTVVGGGASAGNSTGQESTIAAVAGGGGGGAAIKYYPAASLPGPQPYTSGGIGATSSFGAAPIGPISATGGSGASGGVGSGGTIVNARGGYAASAAASTQSGYTGIGGSSIISAGAGLNSSAPSTSYGAGGGGASGPNGGVSLTGGSGAPGAVIIEEFN